MCRERTEKVGRIQEKHPSPKAAGENKSEWKKLQETEHVERRKERV